MSSGRIAAGLGLVGLLAAVPFLFGAGGVVHLEKETIEAQGNLMREYWKKYGVQVPPEIKKAYGVEE